MFAIKKILRSAAVLCVAFVAMLLVGCGGSNPYGLNGVWVNDREGRGRHLFREEIEFLGNAVILRRDNFTIDEATFSISGDNRMEILWRSDGEHQATTFELIENDLAPNRLRISGSSIGGTFTFVE